MICPVCSCSAISVYMTGIFDSADTRVMECADCGLQFLDPMMTDDEEAEYYKNYYENQKSRHYRNNTILDIQRGAYSNYVRHGDVYQWLLKDKIEILEIGSGSGGFLRFAREHINDARIVSVEKSISNREFLKDAAFNDFQDIEVHEDLSTVDRKKKFDLIAAFGVFEHVKDGASFLASLRERLKGRDAMLALQIPNIRNPLIHIYRIEEFKKFAYMKQHYYTYTERSLELLAQKTGYSVDRYFYMQVWGLDNHLSWLRYGRPRDFREFTELLSEETRRSYDRDLEARKVTDAMMVVLKIKQGGVL